MTVILTIVDRFSKAAHFIALPKLPSAFTTAELLVLHVFRLHGIPIDIVSDRGPQFISQVWKAFCKALGATASLSSGYHPQTNGQSERANQILETSLRCMVEREPDSWSSLLPWIEYAHNSLPSSSTGRTPFEVSLGYQPPLFPSHEQDISVPSVQDYMDRCKKIWTETKTTLERTQENHRRLADRHRNQAPPYQPGQSVWLSTKNIPLAAESRKLSLSRCQGH